MERKRDGDREKEGRRWRERGMEIERKGDGDREKEGRRQRERGTEIERKRDGDREKEGWRFLGERRKEGEHKGEKNGGSRMGG
eukprot:643860-Hanusia_phi.AAC.1